MAGETVKGVIETSSDVVAGDSGPLLDAQGEVIGIDTAASTGTQIDGYAIPINDALSIVTQILNGPETASVRIGPAAFLGVELGATTAYGNASQSTGVSGAGVAGVVAGDAAATAGFAAGDTITRIGTTKVSNASGLNAAIAQLQPGDHVTITWVTAEGSTHSATVTLGSSPVN